MSDTTKQADELHEKGQYKQTFDLLKDALEKEPKNADLLWRLARAHYNLGEESTDKTAKEKHIRDGLELASQALAISADNFACHKWYGVLLSGLGDFISTKEKIQNAFKIREHIEQAIKLNGKDATSHHILGKWCLGVANIGWMERKLAATLFGSPPEATLDDALKHLLDASAIDPTFKRNMVTVADVYLQQKKYAEAKEWYNKALAVASVDKAEEALDVHSKNALKKL
eukprot:Opistho-2@17624